MVRDVISDEVWAVIGPFFPLPKATGRPPVERLAIVEATAWRHRTGVPWRDVPERFGNWNTIYKNFHQWAEQGVWARLLEKVQSLTQQRGELDWVASIGSNAAVATSNRESAEWLAMMADPLLARSAIDRLQSSAESEARDWLTGRRPPQLPDRRPPVVTFARVTAISACQAGDQLSKIKQVLVSTNVGGRHGVRWQVFRLRRCTRDGGCLALRSRPAGGGSKPPCAASVNGGSW